MEEHNWKKLKELIQSIKPKEFEKLVAKLLGSLLETHFDVARSGYQPIGDGINAEETIVVQAKRYADTTPLNRKEIVGDINEADAELSNLLFYVLAASRPITTYLRDRLDNIEEETGLDIVNLELADGLSDLGALCVNFWKDICRFFDASSTDQQFLDWVESKKVRQQTHRKIEQLHSKLKDGIQTQKRVQRKTEIYFQECCNERFSPTDLTQSTEGHDLESEINQWWKHKNQPICYLTGEENYGKSRLTARWANSICKDEKIIPFWLESNRWNNCRSLYDLLQACLETILIHQDEKNLPN